MMRSTEQALQRTESSVKPNLLACHRPANVTSDVIWQIIIIVSNNRNYPNEAVASRHRPRAAPPVISQMIRFASDISDPGLGWA
jgi:hypothetical protein